MADGSHAPLYLCLRAPQPSVLPSGLARSPPAAWRCSGAAAPASYSAQICPSSALGECIGAPYILTQHLNTAARLLLPTGMPSDNRAAFVTATTRVFTESATAPQVALLQLLLLERPAQLFSPWKPSFAYNLAVSSP